MKYVDARVKGATKFYALKVMVSCTDEDAKKVLAEGAAEACRAAITALFSPETYGAKGLGSASISLHGPDPEEKTHRGQVYVRDENGKMVKDEEGNWKTEEGDVPNYPESVSLQVALLAIKEVEA